MSKIYGAGGRYNSCDVEDLSEILEEKRGFTSPYLEGNRILVRIDDDYASLFLTGVPSQCGMVVYHDFDYWGQGAMVKALKAADEVVEFLGYSRAMATHVNDRCVELLKNHGFRVVEEFKNKRSGNNVYTLIKTLEPTFDEDEDE